MEFRTCEFTAPSGFKYSIREQNGADEDIYLILWTLRT